MIYFECDNLNKQVDRLKANGVKFDHDLTDQPWLWHEANLKDPDGHQLILFRAGENRINPAWWIGNET